jgi:5-formyltetrahydrofolate cyclo-ligase
MDKQHLRQQMRALRAAMPLNERLAASAQIEKQLRELYLQQNWPHVAVYLASNDEANLDNFIMWLLKRDVCVYAPRNQGFAPLDDLANVYIGNFGVREPQNAVLSLPGDTVFLIPGLAFDKAGRRLGFGGGWYDRALACFQHSLKIGIAFDCQIRDQVPCEPHDVKMDLVVTPFLKDEG